MTSKGSIDISVFRRLAETWGGDVERWPPEQRDAARQTAATEDGRAVLASERALDRRLTTLGAEAGVGRARSDAVKQHVLTAIAGGAPVVDAYRFGLACLVGTASILAASAAIGLGLGVVLPPPSAPFDPVLAFGVGEFLSFSGLF